MGLLKAANSTAIPWNTVQQPDLSDGSSGSITPGANTAGYQPTMALAQNHIHFMGVPGLPAGSVKIFVIHCMFLFLDSFFLSINFFLKKNSLIYATRSTTNGNFPNLPWKNSFFLPNNRCSTRVRVHTRWWIGYLCRQCWSEFFSVCLSLILYPKYKNFVSLTI